VGAAWKLNVAELDPGQCGQVLQLGSDRTASSTATPTFLLYGDGGLSSYVISIDGNEIGTFHSTGRAIVCIDVTEPLAEGPHLLTGVELAPHPGYLVTPLEFSVDTVPPAPPSAPALSAYSDSGVVGDGITRWRNVNFTGTAGPGEAVHVYSNGTSVVGGARAGADGRWSATTVPLADRSYSLTAVTLDTAGNKSAPSAPTRLTVDGTAPATPPAPTVDGNVVRGPAPADVTSVTVFSDGAPIGVAFPDGGEWRLTLPPLEPGGHAIAVTAVDAADNVTPLSSASPVTIGADPGPPSEAPALAPPPEEDAPAPPQESASRPAPPDVRPPEGRRPPPTR
jgi:hypothetical protein